MSFQLDLVKRSGLWSTEGSFLCKIPCPGSLAQFCVWMQTHNLVQVHQRSMVLEQISPFPKKLEEVRISFKIRQNRREKQTCSLCSTSFSGQLLKFSFLNQTEQNSWVVSACRKEMQRPRISLTCWPEAFMCLCNPNTAFISKCLLLLITIIRRTKPQTHWDTGCKGRALKCSRTGSWVHPCTTK